LASIEERLVETALFIESVCHDIQQDYPEFKVSLSWNGKETKSEDYGLLHNYPSDYDEPLGDIDYKRSLERSNDLRYRNLCSPNRVFLGKLVKDSGIDNAVEFIRWYERQSEEVVLSEGSREFIHDYYAQ